MRRTSLKQLAGLPTVQAGLTRLAAARLQRTGIKLEPLMSRTGVTRTQIEDVEQRISAQAQVAFLEAASEALKDDCLGLIPSGADPHALIQSRRPMDMISHGRSVSLFQASQQ